MAEVNRPNITVLVGRRSDLPHDELLVICRRCPLLVQALALTASDRNGAARIICSMDVLVTSFGTNSSSTTIPDAACTIKTPENSELLLPNYIPREVLVNLQ